MDHSRIDAEGAGDHTRTVERRIGIPHELTGRSPFLTLNFLPRLCQSGGIRSFEFERAFYTEVSWRTCALLVNPVSTGWLRGPKTEREGAERPGGGEVKKEGERPEAIGIDGSLDRGWGTRTVPDRDAFRVTRYAMHVAK